MKHDSPRWQEVTPSEHAWEREALDYVREGLPDHEPYRAWSNFEFVADDGSINEVDLLVLAPTGFHLVEIKSWPGSVRGDSGTWVVTRDGRSHAEDNPRLLANRKAKKLVSLLRRQRELKGRRLPFLDARIFLSHPDVQCHLDPHVLTHVHLRDDAAERHPQATGILALLTGQAAPAGELARRVVDRPLAKAISRALDAAGIRRSQAARRVGDHVLVELLEEGATYQDWSARHVKDDAPRWRVRIYCVQPGASAELRETVRRAAEREFRILSGIQHPGILRAFSHTEVAQGPALIFEQEPTAVRLDHFLARRLDSLSLDARLELLRQLAEIVRHAHSKRLVHRALCPASMLVRDPDRLAPQLAVFNWHAGGRKARTTGDEAAAVTPTSHLDRLVDDAATVYMAPEALLDSTHVDEALDVFSLGAIGFHLVVGRAPATSFKELTDALREGHPRRWGSAPVAGRALARTRRTQRPDNADRRPIVPHRHATHSRRSWAGCRAREPAPRRLASFDRRWQGGCAPLAHTARSAIIPDSGWPDVDLEVRRLPDPPLRARPSAAPRARLPGRALGGEVRPGERGVPHAAESTRAPFHRPLPAAREADRRRLMAKASNGDETTVVVALGSILFNLAQAVRAQNLTTQANELLAQRDHLVAVVQRWNQAFQRERMQNRVLRRRIRRLEKQLVDEREGSTRLRDENARLHAEASTALAAQVTATEARANDTDGPS